MTSLLPVVLCGGGMVLCFLLMSRHHNRDSQPAVGGTASGSEEVAALREEVAELRAALRDRDEEHQVGKAGPN